MARVAGDSPHTRGWTLPGPPTVARGLGFPAHAGMDPGLRCHGPPPAGIPRTRGDGPCTRSNPRPHFYGFPAHAGMDRRQVSHRPVEPRIPRTRGDGPLSPSRESATPWDSPHTRCQATLKTDPLATPKTDPRRNGVCRSTSGGSPRPASVVDGRDAPSRPGRKAHNCHPSRGADGGVTLFMLPLPNVASQPEPVSSRV